MKMDFFLAYIINTNIKVGKYCGKFTALAHCATFFYTYRYIKKDAGDMLKKIKKLKPWSKPLFVQSHSSITRIFFAFFSLTH